MGLISPISTAGAYTVRGLMEEPGWRWASVARLKPRLSSFSPMRPTMAATSPVSLSMMVMADWSRWPLEE